MEGTNFIQHNNTTIPMGGSRITQIISAKNGTVIEKKNAFACYKLIAKEGLISIEEVESELYSAGLASGLSQFEVHNTLQSARSGVHI